MAPKPSPDSLIHCAVCGEDYSATYRRCPFCGAKNTPRSTPVPSPAPPSRGRDELDDGYVFDGQNLFDDEPEDNYLPARPKGGKRLAEKSPGPFNDLQINWPRLITFLCSLIIIIAALVIVFTVIYPQLHGKEPPVSNSEQPSASPSQPVPPASQPVSTDPVPANSDPVVQTPVIGVGEDEPTGLTLNRVDFTLRPGEPNVQLRATVTPADWNGTVTWESSDTSLATVSDNGLVSHVKPDVTGVHLVVITARAGTLEAECKVFIAGPKASQPPASEPPAQSDPPVTVTTAPPSNSVTVGRPGVIVGADSGLRVRSGPGTTYDIVASLLNGNSITVLSDAGGGWYQISFTGSGGAAMTGYIMGDYISTN